VAYSLRSTGANKPLGHEGAIVEDPRRKNRPSTKRPKCDRHRPLRTHVMEGRPNRAGVMDGADDQLSSNAGGHTQSRPRNLVSKAWALARPRIGKTSDTDGRIEARTNLASDRQCP
jgi:hypothetical protein